MLSPGKDHLDVPRDLDENVAWREDLLAWCHGKPARQAHVRAICQQDILYYINSFVVQYNPNKPDDEFGPFVTWEFQDDATLEIVRAVEDRKDLLIEKSREMGASWLCLIVMDWLARFHKRKKFLCISKSEEAVESEDPDSLFWKLDYIHRYVPDWLNGHVRRRKRFFEYRATESTITGVASTGDAGVGGRATAAFIDEMTLIKDDDKVLHHTSDTTRCRIFNATHRGTDTAFFQKSQQPDVRKLRMHWAQHPDKRPGLYRYDSEGGKVEVLDKTYSFPPDFEYVLDVKPTGGPYPGIRSPWYDDACRRKGSDRAVAMDLDINPRGSSTQFFDAVTIHYLKRLCTDPVWEGDIEYERDSAEPVGLVPLAGGPIKLWARPDSSGRPPAGRYVAGADISAGTGATESCLAIADAITGEKLLEYASAHLQPHAFAVICVALCRLFRSIEGGTTRFCWERQGPGTPFGQKVLELGYSNHYMQTSPIDSRNKPSTIPGWYPSPENKRILLEDYRAALSSRLFLNRSEKALDECLSFRFDKTGHVGHAEETNMEDPSRGRVNHGDRVIADALCYKMMKDMGLGERKKREEREQAPDPRSVAGRRALWEAHDERKLTVW
jgi:hypothetical protein